MDEPVKRPTERRFYEASRRRDAASYRRRTIVESACRLSLQHRHAGTTTEVDDRRSTACMCSAGPSIFAAPLTIERGYVTLDYVPGVNGCMYGKSTCPNVAQVVNAGLWKYTCNQV